MDPAVAVPIFIVCVMPVSIVGITQYFRFKRDQLKVRFGGDKALETSEKERKQLEARVQNLESIVCSVDFELNQRLNRLAAQHSHIGPALPSPTTPASPTLGDKSTRALAAHSPLLAPLTLGGKVAGRYIIERELGHGGMGAVYLARDEKLGERVALKVVTAQMAADPAEAAARFAREVSMARKVTHPNVVRIHDLIEDGPLLYLSMELVDGLTLAQLLRVGAPPIARARAILAQICDGLGAAHLAGVVHRDLKPQNVLIGANDQVKLIDFGLATASFLQGMTATGLIVGTPEYMAPEQVRGQPCDARTDLYALGALAYHAFVGRPPFRGETPIAVGFAHVTEAPPAPRSIVPDLPAPIEAALLRALEKEPAKRFASAAEFKNAISG